MKDEMRAKWRTLLSEWGVNSSVADRTFEDISRRYSEPGRHYHTLEHIRAVLEAVGRFESRLTNSGAVRLAAWLHDVIYDSRASDNEERSADYARRLCDSLALAEGDRVASLIESTRTHEAANDTDAQILIDADLAILGAGEDEYRRYAEAIRREYAWVSENDYRHGRERVLRGFLARPRIFHFLGELETLARRNLAEEIAALALP